LAHAFKSAVAFGRLDGPFGGMSPPYHERHDRCRSASGDPAPRMYPLFVRYVYAEGADVIDPWQWPQFPVVPVAKYAV
jgi:hypothetical protein